MTLLYETVIIPIHL